MGQALTQEDLQKKRVSDSDSLCIERDVDIIGSDFKKNRKAEYDNALIAQQNKAKELRYLDIFAKHDLTQLEDIAQLEKNELKSLEIKSPHDLELILQFINLLNGKVNSVKSRDLRDNYKVTKFRMEHKSPKKKEHAAHIFSLDLAQYLCRFVEGRISIARLREICNDDANLIMVPPRENLSKHKKIDNKLIHTFDRIIRDEFDREKYKDLFKTNPCKLEREMNINYIRLTLDEADRAIQQAKFIQESSFPHNYTAIARLFYRCFKDYYRNSKEGNHVWNDRNNSPEFKEYWKEKLYPDKKRKTTYNAHEDEKQPEERIHKKAHKTTPKVRAPQHTEHTTICDNDEPQIKTANRRKGDIVFGDDEKGRRLYQGSRGGIYYFSKSGNKVYVTKKHRV